MSLPALRLAAALDRRGVPVLPRLIGWAAWGRWQCRVVGHSTVCAIPMCFRCLREWDSWEDVPRRG